MQNLSRIADSINYKDTSQLFLTGQYGYNKDPIERKKWTLDYFRSPANKEKVIHKNVVFLPDNIDLSEMKRIGQNDVPTVIGKNTILPDTVHNCILQEGCIASFVRREDGEQKQVIKNSIVKGPLYCEGFTIIKHSICNQVYGSHKRIQFTDSTVSFVQGSNLRFTQSLVAGINSFKETVIDEANILYPTSSNSFYGALVIAGSQNCICGENRIIALGDDGVGLKNNVPDDPSNMFLSGKPGIPDLYSGQWPIDDIENPIYYLNKSILKLRTMASEGILEQTEPENFFKSPSLRISEDLELQP